VSPAHLLLAGLIASVWGFNFYISKLGVNHVPPIFFGAYRYILVFVLLLPWLKPLKGQMGRVAAIALTSGALHFGFILLGFQMTEHVGPVAIALQVNIPFMVLLAILLLGEKVGVYRLGGMVLGFAGIMIIGFDPVAFQDPAALAAVITGGLFFGTSIILMRRLDGGHPMQVQAWVAAISLPFLLGASAIVEEGQIQSVIDFGWLGVAVILFTSIGASIIGHGGMFFLLQRYPVTFLVPVLIAPPILGVFFGVWLNDDPITTKIALGGLMTIGGVGIIQVREAVAARRKEIHEAGV